MSISRNFEMRGARKADKHALYGPPCSISNMIDKYTKMNREDDYFLIIISAKEKEYIVERMPDVHIRRTVKQKSKRHKYYMEESKNAMRLLRNLRKTA